MVFHSYAYVFVFLPATFLLYSLVRKTRFRNVVLLIASYIFYTGGSLFLFMSLACVSVLDYWWARKIHETSNEKKKKLFLVLSLVGNLAWLSLFKYVGWFVSTINNVSFHYGWVWSIPQPHLPLPPGISFYTFQTMSYTLDVYMGAIIPERNILNYLTYVSFFPQLVAGPIERASHLLPQLAKIRKTVSAEHFKKGVFLIVWGLFKKVVCADNLGHLVDVCLRYLHIPGMGLILVYAFGFQIYCDFSAYTDIARGTAKLFNVELIRNFWTPYFAVSPSDFWRRWHISLSSWLRDYIYTPLAFSKRNWGDGGVVFALMVTFFLCGLWHGAGIFFIMWGLYHGLLLTVYRFIPIDQFLIQKWGRFGKVVAIFLMFQLTSLGWLFFRSNPSSLFPSIWLSITNFFNHSIDRGFASAFWILLLFSAPIVITDYMGYRRQCEFVDLYERFGRGLKVLLFVFVFYAICFLGKRETYDFIYFAF